MRPQQFASFRIENRFDKTAIIAKGNRLAIASKGELANFKIMASLFRRRLSHAN